MMTNRVDKILNHWMEMDKNNMELKDLRHDHKIMKAALEYVSMPITTKKEDLTVDKLLATIAEDSQRVKETFLQLRTKEPL